MADFGVDVDPGEVGLDGQRLRRIDEHFARYVDDGRLPGWQVMVSRRGRVAHLSSYGLADKEQSRPVEPDTIWRIYSMTKPVTSVAAMMLWEQGAFELVDPVSKWLPEFADMRVYAGGSAAKHVTVPAVEPIRVWHLLTHTAGLTYGFHRVHVTDEIYRNAGFEFGNPRGFDLQQCVEAWAALPLAFQPGAGWWKSSPASRSPTSSPNTSSTRSTWSTPAFTSSRNGGRGWRRSTRCPRAAARWCGSTPSATSS